MDRKLLIGLLQDGMRYSAGKHRLWISRCFEITVRSDQVVELDEYESFAAEENLHPMSERVDGPKGSAKMFHVGKSILHLKDGQVVEKGGSGWSGKVPARSPAKKA